MNTASPEMFDLAPKDLPWKTGPSYNHFVSVSKTLRLSCALKTYSDGECSSIMRDWGSLRSVGWHSTSSTAFNGCQASSLADNFGGAVETGRLEGRRLHESSKHYEEHLMALWRSR